jgi:hypothetical protein
MLNEEELRAKTVCAPWHGHFVVNCFLTLTPGYGDSVAEQKLLRISQSDLFPEHKMCHNEH